MSAMFVGLYGPDQMNQHFCSPILADGEPIVKVNGTDFTSPDLAMKIRVTLKPDLKFSDGTPLTVDDVIYTYKMLLMPKVDRIGYNTWPYYFQNNDSFIKIDENTVEFDVHVFYFEYHEFLMASILPQEIYQPSIDSGNYDFELDYKTFLIGAGPFKLVALDENQNIITLKQNTYWVGSKPRVETLIFKKIFNKSDALNEVNSGAVQLLDKKYLFQPAELENTTNVASSIIGEFEWQEMSFNQIHPVYGDTAQQDRFIDNSYIYNNKTYVIQSYWKNQGVTDEDQRREDARLVRQAMDTVVPRQEIIDDTLLGLGLKIATIWPQIAIGYDPSITPREYNIATARDLMEQAGFDYTTLTYDSTHDTYTSFFFNVTLLSPISLSPRITWSQRISETLTKIGIGTTLITTDWPALTSRFIYDFSTYSETGAPVPLYNQGGYDIIFIGYARHSSSFNFITYSLYESYNWLSQFTNDGFNWYNWYDTKYDSLSASYHHETDRTQRITLAHQLQKYYFTNVITSAIVEPASLWVYGANVTGIDFTALNKAKQQWEYVGYGELPSSSVSQAISTLLSTEAILPWFIGTQVLAMLATVIFITKKRLST